MAPEEELKAAAEKYAKTVGIAHCVLTLKLHDAECRDVQVQQNYHFEGRPKALRLPPDSEPEIEMRRYK